MSLLLITAVISFTSWILNKLERIKKEDKLIIEEDNNWSEFHRKLESWERKEFAFQAINPEIDPQNKSLRKSINHAFKFISTCVDEVF